MAYPDDVKVGDTLRLNQPFQGLDIGDEVIVKELPLFPYKDPKLLVSTGYRTFYAYSSRLEPVLPPAPDFKALADEYRAVFKRMVVIREEFNDNGFTRQHKMVGKGDEYFRSLPMPTDNVTYRFVKETVIPAVVTREEY